MTVAPACEHRGDLHVVLALVARDRVHRDVGDRLVRDDRALHLEARDVLAPPAQVVLLAVDEVEEPVVVEPAEVAGVEPEVAQHLDGRLRAAPVAREHQVRAGGPAHDLADLADRDLVGRSSSTMPDLELVRRSACPRRRPCSASPAGSIEISDASVSP